MQEVQLPRWNHQTAYEKFRGQSLSRRPQNQRWQPFELSCQAAAGIGYAKQFWQQLLRVVQEHGAERSLLGRSLYGYCGIERVQVRNERRKMNDHEIDAEGFFEMGFFILYTMEHLQA